MSLLVLMYHRASAGPDGNSPRMLDDHFGHIAATYGCLLPGEPLAPGRLNLCLSFDDATSDFHTAVFPLLQKHGLRALLAVSPDRIPDERERGRDGYCTWTELREMERSGSVRVAAHGLTHRRLDDPAADLAEEITLAQSSLFTHLGRTVDSFVFPYGRISTAARWQARKSYRYSFRIGGGDNAGWDSELLYRVPADGLSAPDEPFARPRLALYRVRRIWNRIRGR